MKRARHALSMIQDHPPWLARNLRRGPQGDGQGLPQTHRRALSRVAQAGQGPLVPLSVAAQRLTRGDVVKDRGAQAARGPPRRRPRPGGPGRNPRTGGARAGRRYGTLICLAQRRQGELRSKARELGRRLCARAPDCLADEFRGHWKAWKKSAQSIHPMPKQPARGGEAAQADEGHGPVLVEQQGVRGALEEDPAQHD